LPDKKEHRGLVTYISDNNKIKSNAIYCTIYTLQSKGIGLKYTELTNSVNGKFFSVEEWVFNIKNADYVITDSFHGMLFSVLFSKQFIVS